MGFFDELKDVTREAIRDFGIGDDGEQIRLAWNGKTVDAMQEDAGMDVLLEDGGAVGTERPVFRCLKSDFGAKLPKAMDRFTVAGKSYLVDFVTTSDGDPEIRITGKLSGAR